MYRRLTKLFIKENFSLKRISGVSFNKSKTKAILIGLAIVYAIVVFFGSFGYMFFNFGEILDEMGLNPRTANSIFKWKKYII